MKKTTKVIVAVLVVAALLVGASFYGGKYLLGYALQPGNDRGQDEEASYAYMYEQYPYLKSWVDSLHVAHALRDTFVTAYDMTKLHAYYVPSPSPTKATAVIVHGYTDNAVRMFMIGRMYHRDLGYNILLPDLHYSGRSGGDHFQMGWFDRIDLLHWMDVANSIFGDSTQMVVHGISMGAATTMMASGEAQRDFVKCFVEDCGYTSVWDEFAHELKGRFHLPEFPLLHIADYYCKKKYGWSFKEASALEQVRKCKLPMLFIHGDKDDFVPTRMVYDLYDAKPTPKELWLVPGAAHAISYKENAEEYTQRVGEFVGKYIVE